MRLAICDDDSEIIQSIKPVLYQYANDHRFEMVIETFYCGEELLRSDISFDMILLDYEMGELNGMQTAHRLRNKNINCAIIFITNHTHFVFNAFEVNAFRFFRKPLLDSDLNNALDAYFCMYGHDYPILLKCDREILEINTKDIVSLEAMGRNCIIHLKNNYICCTKSMSNICQKIPMHHFYKVSRSAIVNLNYIEKHSNKEIILKNGEKIGIGERYNKEFRCFYRDYTYKKNPLRAEKKNRS